jgi:predicted small secreted protein
VNNNIAWRLAILGVLAGLLAGCDTFAAFGRDLQKAGKSIEKKAEAEKKK